MKSLILLLAVFIVFFFSGCTNASTINKVRFQSVPATQATLLQVDKDKESCSICGMHLATFYKTNHVADTKNGVKQYCSLHCVVKDNEFNKTDLTNLKVVDTNSLKFIPVLKAFYVVGSSKKGTMSRVSKYAFSKKVDAEIFAKEFGGKVMKFYDAYDEATKDFTRK